MVDVACRAGHVVASIVLSSVAGDAIIAIAIRVESSGPVLFRQRRLGDVKPFRSRSSGPCARRKPRGPPGVRGGPDRRREAAGGEGTPRFKLAADPRITRVGQLLRKTSLDELPQLWNVLRGDMSLVGPRPPISYEVERSPPHWFARFRVKPGITGLWQVSGRCELTLEQMIQLDIEYVRQRSLW